MGSLHDSRRFMQFQCPNLSEKQLAGFTALVLVSLLDVPENRQNRLIRLGGQQYSQTRVLIAIYVRKAPSIIK